MSAAIIIICLETFITNKDLALKNDKKIVFEIRIRIRILQNDMKKCFFLKEYRNSLKRLCSPEFEGIKIFLDCNRAINNCNSSFKLLNVLLQSRKFKKK